MRPIELLENGSEVLAYNVPGLPMKLGASSGRTTPIRTMVNHWHDDLEFTRIISGEMHYRVNGVPIKLQQGQMIFVNAARMHCNFWAEQEYGDFACTIFHPSMIDSASLQKYAEQIMGDKAPPYIVFYPESPRDRQMIDLVARLHEEVSVRSEGYELGAQACAYGVMRLLLEHMQSAPELTVSEDKRLASMHRMIGFVQQRYTEKLTLADIAAAGFVSRSTCCELFRHYTGQTPMTYLIDYRISKGAELLTASTMSITDIAAQCGFGGASYFTETFRKLMGCTPLAFRQQHQHGGQER